MALPQFLGYVLKQGEITTPKALIQTHRFFGCKYSMWFLESNIFRKFLVLFLLFSFHFITTI
jgi:hypothetical protein